MRTYGHDRKRHRGFDGSPESVAATRWAAREARLRGAPLCLLHVARSPATPEVPLHRPGPPSASTATLLRQAAKEAERDHQSLVVTVEERAGRPAAELAGAVDDIGRTQLRHGPPASCRRSATGRNGNC